ncbi:ATP-dependent RNA helicase dbp3 [Geopyxis carbonaria]|nr:ATP-dependent RNA helicase dbp3 [Geopyxis carbonaria]
MSKRTIEDVDAAAATAAEKALKKKQRKEKKAAAAAVDATDAAPVENGEKKEKKDKKEKKEKKEKKSKKDAAPAEDAMDVDTPAAEAPKLPQRPQKPPPTPPRPHPPSPAPRPPAAPPISTADYQQSADLTALPDATVQAYLKEHSIGISDPRSSNLRPITEFRFLPAHTFDFGGFAAPTPIQAATWPFTLSGQDCIGVAETGSGKTLAFAVPAIRHICALLAAAGGPAAANKLGVRVLAVSPTRELAMQIFEVLEKYSAAAGLTAVCVYGGVAKDEQRAKLRRAQIVVATPGRLNDLIDEGSADLSRVSYLVLDEADRMLDKGFEDDIRRILGAITTPQRQTLMFTATWPQSVRELAATFMRTPAKITIGDSDDLRANIRITQTVEVLDGRAKEQRLLALVKQHQSGAARDDRVLVFCLYKKEASRVEGFLRSKGLRVAGIHGDLGQAARTQALAQFKSGACPLLVATDVAARGLDIPAVKLVINVTFPLTIEDYVHRIGRTGRAGANGLAYTFFTEQDKAHSGSLINILKAAKQEVPESLLKFGTTVKKKEHSAYGAFYKDTGDVGKSTKITFDD